MIFIHDGMDGVSDTLEDLSGGELLQLKNALRGGAAKLNGKLKKVWENAGGSDIGDSFQSDEYHFNIVPTNDPDQRDSIYVTGPSGSGKSCWIAQFIAEYNDVYPDRDVVVFSAKNEDPALDQFDVIRIPLNEGLVNEPVELEELKNSLVIFDDIDQLSPKDLQEAVWKLRDKILEVGRSLGISICTVAHQITNYKASRVCLNEADYVVFFPKSGSSHQIKYFLKNYAGMDKEQISKVMKLKSRSAILKKTYPMAMVYSNGCYVV